MNIEQAREAAHKLRTHTHPNILSIDRSVMADGAEAIDALIAERDAQRKVLDQALEILNAIHPDFVCQATHHKNKDEHDGFDDCPNVSRHQAAITAIQEVLAS